jgi:hypothetical protein
MGLNGEKRAYLLRVHRNSDRECAARQYSKKDPSKNAMDCRDSQFLVTAVKLTHRTREMFAAQQLRIAPVGFRRM